MFLAQKIEKCVRSVFIAVPVCYSVTSLFNYLIIFAQAFSDEFSHEENGTLRQQVLHLLFSRVQLQPLQAFVCSHMINALERFLTVLFLS